MIAIDLRDPSRSEPFYRFTGLLDRTGLPHDLSLSADGTHAYIPKRRTPSRVPAA